MAAKGYFIILLLLFCLSDNYAQNPITFSTEDGLPSVQVYDLITDAEGFLWLATDKGVCRFDGKKINRFYDLDKFDEAAIRLYRDKKNRIWVIFYSGRIAIWDKGRFLIEDLLHNQKKRINYYSIIWEQDEKNTWIGTENGSLFHLQADTISAQIQIPSLLLGVRRIEKTNRDTLICYWGTRQAGAVLLTDQYGNELKKDIGSTWSTLNLAYSDTLGNQQIYLSEDNILFITDQQKQDIPLPEKKLPILRMKIGKNKKLYVCTQNKGFYVFDMQTDTWTQHLLGISVTDIEVDYQDNVWASTLYNGLYCIPKKNDNIQSIKELSQGAKKILRYQDCLWFISSNDRLYSLEVKGNDTTTKSYGLEGCNQLIATPEGLVVSSSLGLYRLDHKKQKIRLYDQALKGAVYSAEGILIYNRKRLGLLNNSGEYCPIEEFSGVITDLSTDADGFYVGTQEGLFYANLQGEIFRYQGELLNMGVYALHLAHDNTLWIANKTGLLHIHKTGQVLHHIRAKEQEEVAYIQKIGANSEREIWVGTNQGLYRVNPGSAGTYTLQAILEGNKTLGSVQDFTFGENALWLVSNKACYLLQNLQVESKQTPFYPIICIKKEANYYYNASEWELSYGDFPLQLRIEYPQMQQKGVLEYKIGDNAKWNAIHEVSLTLHSLAPGFHTLYVKFHALDGSSSPIQKCTIKVNPLFWQRWEFYLLIFICSTASLIFFFVQKLRKTKELHQEQLNAERENYRLRSVAMQAQMNPHFLFNALNTLQSFILRNQGSSAITYIDSFSKLFRSILNLSFKDKVKLQDELAFLELYLKVEQMGTSKNFHFEIILDEELEGDELIPPMILQPFIENTLKHAFPKLTEREPDLKVFIQGFETYLSCEIIDNGIGRIQSKANSVRTSHVSSGISITEARLKMYSHLPQPPIYYTDLVEEDKSMGTSVTLFIPILF